MQQSVTNYEVAAFSEIPTRGSPTGVVLEADHLTDDQMLWIAQRLNFSHTAFITELAQPDCDILIRFFTPLLEIKNCGHATIAAHILRAACKLSEGDYLVRQKTLSGIQEVRVHHHNGNITAYLKQNPIQFFDVSGDTLNSLLSTLGLTEADLHLDYPVMTASPGENRFLLPVNSAEIRRSIKPNFSELKALCDTHQSIGCFVFTVDAPDEITGRMFAPSIGVDEDVINANSSGCLGAYLLRLSQQFELNLRVHQGHTFNRTGTVLVNARRIDGQFETRIGGTSVIVSERQIPLEAIQKS